jgi:hypothetical protein
LVIKFWEMHIWVFGTLVLGLGGNAVFCHQILNFALLDWALVLRSWFFVGKF